MAEQQLASETSLQGAPAYNEYFPKKAERGTGSHVPWVDRHQGTHET